jgi:hypothetical protein
MTLAFCNISPYILSVIQLCAVDIEEGMTMEKTFDQTVEWYVCEEGDGVLYQILNGEIPTGVGLIAFAYGVGRDVVMEKIRAMIPAEEAEGR